MDNDNYDDDEYSVFLNTRIQYPGVQGNHKIYTKETLNGTQIIYNQVYKYIQTKYGINTEYSTLINEYNVVLQSDFTCAPPFFLKKTLSPKVKHRIPR